MFIKDGYLLITEIIYSVWFVYMRLCSRAEQKVMFSSFSDFNHNLWDVFGIDGE